MDRINLIRDVHHKPKYYLRGNPISGQKNIAGVPMLYDEKDVIDCAYALVSERDFSTAPAFGGHAGTLPDCISAESAMVTKYSIDLVLLFATMNIDEIESLFPDNPRLALDEARAIADVVLSEGE